jgi:site-specific DNA recombinase
VRELDQWHKASHHAPLSEDVVNANIKTLDERAEEWKFNKQKGGVQTTYLGGLLFCKHCGGKYAKNSGRTRGDGTKNVYYACYSRSKKVQKMIKDPNCMNKNWRMDYLDDLVFHEIRMLAENTDKIKQMNTQSRKAQEEPDKANIILKEIEKIDSQISRFMDLYGVGTFSINQVSEKINPLNERKNALQKELVKINSSMGKITVEQAIEYVKSCDGVLANGNFNDIRELIESLIYYIELDNDNVSIHWRFA